MLKTIYDTIKNNNYSVFRPEGFVDGEIIEENIKKKIKDLKTSLINKEKVILFHSENIDFYRGKKMRELMEIYNNNKNSICVLAHGENKHFSFEYINHYDFWIEIKYLNNNFKLLDHTEEKNKDFLFLTRRLTYFRRTLCEKLENVRLLDNSLYTFNHITHERHLPGEYEHPKFHDITFKKNDPWYKSAIWKILPKQYTDTKYSIVGETVEENNIYCLSEKIFKALISGHIFVVLAGAGFLKYLRNIGFQTFAGYIDESYDEEQDINQRISKIVSLCRVLTNTDHRELYKNTQAIRQHNYNLFFNNDFLAEKNKEILQKIEKFFNN